MKSKRATASWRASFTPTKTPAIKSAETQFKEVNQAYDALGDAKKRALYDEFGEDALREGFDADRVRQYKSLGRAAGAAPASGRQAGGAPFNIEDVFA